MTQQQRREDTRQRLLAAARDLIAERGVSGASVDALAEAAERTSGALYGQFGNKDGLLLALVDHWKDATATAIAADFEVTSSREQRLSSLWANFAEPPVEGGDVWVVLEHELWLYACRNPAVRDQVAARYASAQQHLASAIVDQLDGPPDQATGADARTVGTGRGSDARSATLVIALLIGLEMQRRLDPSAVSDELALAGLKALLSATDS